MQHQMSLRIKGALYNLNNYMNFIKQIDEDLDIMQSDKLKLDLQDFQTKITNDWWLNGKHIVKNNAADQLVSVYCDSELVDIKDEIKNTSPYLEIKVIFSKCPLSREPIEIVINTKMTDKNMDKDVYKFIESIVPSKFINKYKYNSKI
jgi:hypothetical protein